MNKILTISVVIIIIVLIAGYFVFFNNSNFEQNPESNTDNNEDGLPSGVIENNPNGNANDNTADSTSPRTVEVLIQNYDYTPKTIEINVGDTVIWTNKDNIGHTVTSDSGKGLDSLLFTKDGTYEHTFTMVETYDYHCKPHPYMKGTVIVN